MRSSSAIALVLPAAAQAACSSRAASSTSAAAGTTTASATTSAVAGATSSAAAGSACTVTSYADIATAVAECTDIVLQDIYAPANSSIDLTGLQDGTTVTFAGNTVSMNEIPQVSPHATDR